MKKILLSILILAFAPFLVLADVEEIPSFPALSVSCQLNTAVDNDALTGNIIAKINSPLDFEAIVSGGDGNYQYDWDNEGFNTNANFSKNYSSLGIYPNFSLTVKSGDSQESTVSCATDEIYVKGDSAEGQTELNSTCSPSSSEINTGYSINWNAVVSGGGDEYFFIWNGDGINNEYGSSDVFNKEYNSAGNFSNAVTIWSVDGGEETVDCGSVSVSETISETDLSVQCVVDTTEIVKGNSVNFVVQVAGAVGQIFYIWSGDDELSGDSENINHTYSNSGEYNTTLYVEDDVSSISINCSTVNVLEEEKTDENSSENDDENNNNDSSSGSRKKSSGSRKVNIIDQNVQNELIGNLAGFSSIVDLGYCDQNPFLKSYLGYGLNNDSYEVQKLQLFLNIELNSKLEINGIFDIKTFEAVKQLQLKYSDYILKPWVEKGLLKEGQATGYVYQTTLKFINERVCVWVMGN